jgi:hypothetical protein
VMDAIRSTEKGGRGQVLWNIVRTLKEDGWTVTAIVALLAKYPDGLAAKFRGRLQREVERVYDKIKESPGPGAKKSVVMSCAEDLRTMTFNPIKYVVPGVLVEGLTVLAGKPKIGKSWLLLHAAIAVARSGGGFTLGDIHCIEGDVLYCALEDNARRMKSRITKLLGVSQPWPKRLTLCYDLPRLGEGGAEAIRDWIMSVPNPRMVAIDTLAMIRALKKVDESNYQSDYLALLELRALANEFGIALPVSHHLRKAEADDPFDTISGTLGLTGAVDSMLVLKRSVRGGGNYVLHGKGRDLVEIEKALTFDRDACLWRIAGDAAPVQRSAERTLVLGAIEEAGEPIGPNDIAAEVGMKSGNVRRLLGKLVKEGAIEKAGKYGRYCLPGTKPAEPQKEEPKKKSRSPAGEEDTVTSEPFTSQAGGLKPVQSSPDVMPKRRRRRNRMQRWLDHVQAGDDPQGELILAMRGDPDMREFESPQEMADYFRGVKAKLL